MTIRTIVSGAGLALMAATAHGQTGLRSNAHLGFTYPLSTNGIHAADYSNVFSVHCLAGVSRAEEAFCASGIASVVKDSARGFLAGGVATVVGGSVSGFQGAGFINVTAGNVKGVQSAGFVNITGRANGAQLGGFANVAMHAVDGAQVAGFLNSADTATVQVAGFVNVARNTNTQIAGFANVADTVNGAQIAGFINVARRVKGTQIAGFINIADSSDRPIGLINIIGNGEQAVGVTINEIGTTMVALRSGGKKLYGILGVGVNVMNGYRATGLEAGIGAHFPVTRSFRFNGEITTSTLTDRWYNTDFRSSVRFMPSFRAGNIEIFAGPSFNYTGSSDIQGVGRVGYSIYKYDSYNFQHDFSIGLDAGIQYHFNSRKIVRDIIDGKKF